MELRDWISTISVLVALVAFSVPQWRLWREQRSKSLRTEHKLRLLYLCQTNSFAEQQIIDRYKEQLPASAPDEAEIRKSIYEMLAEGTLVFIADRKTYEVRSHLPREPGIAVEDETATHPRRYTQPVLQQQPKTGSSRNTSSELNAEIAQQKQQQMQQQQQ